MTERVYLHYNRDLWAELIKPIFPLPSIAGIWVLDFVNYVVLALKWPAHGHLLEIKEYRDKEMIGC